MEQAVASTAVCSECGERLGSSGACVACLIRAGFDDLDGASASAGERFGNFEIERRDDGSLFELGRGAMGVTYRARDTVLHRDVALKVIEPPAASDSGAVRERFLREARSAAALRHPNIAAVYQFGATPERDRCYCAMELVEGETLEARVRRDGPIDPDLALEIGLQVSRALMAASERGLVHRDLKPGNIMLTSKAEGGGDVKVIDFGLAKAISSVEQMELTHGGFVGTPAFASPEQFAGEQVDPRTDIYALGVTLWFALTGRLPSAGTTVEEIHQRQREQALPTEQLRAKAVPPPLIDLLRSCLAVNPEERPASARELLRALESCRDQLVRTRTRRRVALVAAAACLLLATAAVSAVVLIRPAVERPNDVARPLEKGLAVLPFENLSREEEDAFFADGIQDDILTSLGKIKDLKVIARASVMQYRGARAARNVREIGHALGVTHVLEGSVRRAGDRVALNVSLIDTRDERQVWSERYERSLTDTLSLQGELALEIARTLRATLSPAEQTVAAAKPTDNPDAYLAYLRGRESELATTPRRSLDAIGHYQRAIDLDPNFALARARLSICASQQFYEGRDATWQTQARAQAQEAFRLRPDLGETHLAMAYCQLYVETDLDRAIAALSRAGELLPNSAEVPLVRAFIYKRQGRFRDRIAALERAEALDPRNTGVLTFLILTYRWVRDWPEALRAVDRIDVVLPPDRADRRRWGRATIEFRLSGDVTALKRVLAEYENPESPRVSEWVNAARYELAMLERDYAAAEWWLAQVTQKALDEANVPTVSTHLKSFHEALLTVTAGGDAARRQQTLERARAELQARLQGRTAGSPGHHAEMSDLAIIDAFLGRKEEAIANAFRAMDDQQLPLGSIERNYHVCALALVYAQTGEADKAIELIEQLLTQPIDLHRGAVFNLTLTDLKWQWVWDPLRSHPRFQKLLAGPEPRTVY